jgi:DNA-binding LacI/PurR family transcriptional regulator
VPSVRRLATRFGVAKKTIEKAMRQLTDEGLLVSVPRQGFRVLPRAGEPDRGLPLAYVAHVPGEADGFWDEFHKQLLASFQQTAAGKGWSLLSTGCNGENVGEVLDQLRAAGVCGAIIDSFDPALRAGLQRQHIPFVAVDGWPPDADCDVVNQDGFLGGYLAARYLLAAGHERICFFGAKSLHNDLQIGERYGGTQAALVATGQRFAPADVVLSPLSEGEEIIRSARRLLSRADRPRAILSLWQRMTAGLCAASRDLGLVPGRDFDMVGWSTLEGYRSEYLTEFAGGPVPPAVTWRVAEMAEAAVRILKFRRAEPDAPPMHHRVRVQLHMAEPAVSQ